MNTDITHFTNEGEIKLTDRVNTILKHNTQFFDILVGYFRLSGFHMIEENIDNVDKIRILVGLQTEKSVVDIIHDINTNQEYKLPMKTKSQQKEEEEELKEKALHRVKTEVDNCEDDIKIYKGLAKFIELIKGGKLEIRGFKDRDIHAKVYIFKDFKGRMDGGRVITGSSNLSYNGLSKNFEFNVELKNKSDLDFASEKFEMLWEDSVDLTESYKETLIETTWLKDDITPYELYLKTLMEYFSEEINEDKNSLKDFLPEGFDYYTYQQDAVLQAEKIIHQYNGVFISDVVGLGKTLITSLLAKRLNKNTLFIVPPKLMDNWQQYKLDFDIKGDVESLGKLENLVGISEKYDVIVIDEAHKFRNDKSYTYSLMHSICKGKKVILVTATPQNNYSKDIASLLYLFQDKNRSTILPGRGSLEDFFRKIGSDLSRAKNIGENYKGVLKESSEKIRTEILNKVMVRRTRGDIKKFYRSDIIEQKLSFPEVKPPIRLIYELSEHQSKLVEETLNALKSGDVKYCRYTPHRYLKQKTEKQKHIEQSEYNLTGFMKTTYVKRLESSQYAFKNTLRRLVESYKMFIDMYNRGAINICAKRSAYDNIDLDSDEDWERLNSISDNRIEVKKLKDEYITDLTNDYKILRSLLSRWEKEDEDPKLNQFIEKYKETFGNKKVIIFTESSDTADYLEENFRKRGFDRLIKFDGGSSKGLKEKILENFDPKHKEYKNDIDILITTDVLSEGVNLHRGNIIVNYDLPWNPVRIIQRSGRVNRVGTKHSEIHLYNYFPCDETASVVNIEDNIKNKIQAFHDALGEDSKYLHETENVSSHTLFDDLSNVEGLNNEEVSNIHLQYIEEIRNIRDNDTKLFNKIKRLPKKSRTSKKYNVDSDELITLHKKGKVKQFIKATGKGAEELDFIAAIETIKSDVTEKRQYLKDRYYDLLGKSINRFKDLEKEETIVVKDDIKGTQKQLYRVIDSIINMAALTNTEEDKLRLIQKRTKEGALPTRLVIELVNAVKQETDTIKMAKLVINNVGDNYLNTHQNNENNDRSEIVLSMYLLKQ